MTTTTTRRPAPPAAAPVRVTRHDGPGPVPMLDVTVAGTYAGLIAADSEHGGWQAASHESITAGPVITCHADAATALTVVLGSRLARQLGAAQDSAIAWSQAAAQIAGRAR